ncbi:SpoIIE family protein phosphatase [Kitasatospora cathayae]|uniref:SpoIIE family protein phosphatase n=1 Tax=Kitasatospora cathayae TaxID=3004092 RepID=A0ABY7PVK4_9ACTN|nr:SpoIIE family protein phosphatase [Kitasatospora sp. HUAS 3-15]WBP84454.1 SpoIIE family protein phosphatase [Kitasatospora sp. HUAS 3-15]
MTARPELEESTALALAGTVRRLQDAAARLRAEARIRSVVDLATGVLSERLGVLPAEAAAHLVRLAREAGVPVVALAADITGLPAVELEAARAPTPGTAGGSAPGTVSGSAPASPPVAPAIAAEPDLQRAAGAVLEQLTASLGVRSLAVWQRLPGGALALAAHSGFAEAEAEAWSRVPPGVATPAQQVVGGAAELWPGDPTAAGPSIGTGVVRAVLPLLETGRRRGALEVLWPEPGPALTPSQRRQLRALAELCTTLLGPAGEPPMPEDLDVLLEGLLTPALLLEPELRDGHLADFTIRRVNAQFRDPLGRPRDALEGTSFLEAYPVAGATGLFERLLAVHRSGVPLPGGSVQLVLRDGPLAVPVTVRLAVAPLGGQLLVGWEAETRPPDEDEQTALLRQAQRLARVAGFEEDADHGRIRWSAGLREFFGLPAGAPPVPLAQLARHVHPDDEPAVRRLVDTVRHRLRTSSAVFRLARPDGSYHYTRVIAEPVLDDAGRLAALRGAYHDVSAQHRTELALGATRARLADSEQESAERAQLALRLQQAILPTAPPPLGVNGLRAAVRYRPAAKRDRVGGDWYDILPLPDKRVLLAVGDVAGHGVGAATGMVALRHALRGLAVTGAGPAQLLEWANTVALREPGQVTATAVCVLLDPAGGELRWARAGHLPPIRLGRDGAHVLPLPHGVLLGALDEARYEEHRVHLSTGDVLLLYTDGLVERRDRPVEDSVDQLIRTAGAPGPDLEHYLDRLLDLSPADTEDDTCLIAVRVE